MNSNVLNMNCVLVIRFIVSPLVSIVIAIAVNVGKYNDLPIVSLNSESVLHVFVIPPSPISVISVPIRNVDLIQGTIPTIPSKYFVVP